MPWHIQLSHEEDIITLNYPSHPDERVGTPPLNPHRGILVLAVCVLLLVPGAAAVTIVLNDGPASLSLAATPDGSVAVAVIAASQPSGYSATLSARDTGGVAAGQESTVTGAREILAVTAWEPDNHPAGSDRSRGMGVPEHPCHGCIPRDDEYCNRYPGTHRIAGPGRARGFVLR